MNAVHIKEILFCVVARRCIGGAVFDLGMYDLVLICGSLFALICGCAMSDAMIGVMVIPTIQLETVIMLFLYSPLSLTLLCDSVPSLCILPALVFF